MEGEDSHLTSPLHALHALALAGLACAAGDSPRGERVIAPDLLDNGGFEERSDAEDELGLRPVPWWRTSRGQEQLVSESGRPALRTAGKEWAEQPLAAFAPLAGGLVLEGEVRGSGRLTLIDGKGARAAFDLDGPDWRAFRLDGEELAQRLGHAPQPRFVLRLEAREGGEARWRALHAHVPLPCPDEAALRAEIVGVLERVVPPWLEHGLDREGPRPTSFVVHGIDAVDGQAFSTFAGGFHPFWEQLWNVAQAIDHPRWKAAFEDFAADFLELGLDPDTGLPRNWDGALDEPVGERSVEIALAFGFLIDLAERGPEPLRPRARAAARKIGETVLARGVQPDGSVGAKYFPASGALDTGVVSLRRFDVPAQLARLTAVSGDERYLRAAGEALAVFEFTHAWTGAWWKIDPGFDDDFGHYVARSVTIATAAPQDELFRRFALDSWEHFAPLWHDALRLGGNVAADQVRCWTLLADLARLDEAAGREIRPLLGAAVRSHFKGEQYEDGAWGDVTIYGFDPIVGGLQVGDYPGAPQNLLHGLAALYRADLGLRGDELRAMYTAVLRSSVATYLEPHGFLMDRRRKPGRNPAAGTLRMMLGLSKMLRALG